MTRYRYVGPVMEYGRCLQDRFEGETVAESPKKAKSNILYNWKRDNNRMPGSKITLPGKIIAMD